MIARLASKTGLSESQVYKWNWDQRKKFKESCNLEVNMSLPYYAQQNNVTKNYTE
jgi:hypothetical protein